MNPSLNQDIKKENFNKTLQNGIVDFALFQISPNYVINPNICTYVYNINLN